MVGLSVAHFLKKAGADPLVIEAGRAGGGCSMGNGGLICPSLAVPVAAPGLTWRALWQARDPRSTLHAKPFAPGVLTWLLRMRRHCRPEAYERGARALGALAADANERWAELASDGVEFEMSRAGLLVAARDSGGQGALSHKMDAIQRSGASCRAVGADELLDLEPLLRPGFKSGLLVESDGHVRPETVSRGLARALREGGTEIREHAVADGFVCTRDGVSRGRRRAGARGRPALGSVRIRAGVRGRRRVQEVVVRERSANADGWEGSGGSGRERDGQSGGQRNGQPSGQRNGQPSGQRNSRSGIRQDHLSGKARAESQPVDAVVLAAGARTGRLARKLGARLPVTAGKGYSLTIEEPGQAPRRPVYFADAATGCVPYRDALRCFWGIEFSGVNERMDLRRVRVLRRAVAESLRVPGLDRAAAWMGMRPVLPDTLPAIGRLPGCENAYVATGHQMLGMTLAPATGAALARAILAGEPDPILAPFSPERLAR